MVKIHKAVYVGLIGALAATLVGATLTSASAAEPNGGAQPVYILDANDGTVIPAGTKNAFAKIVVAGPLSGGSSGDPELAGERYVGSADATSVATFVALPGDERTPSAWKARGLSGFYPGTKDTWLPSIALSNQNLNNIQGVKAAGGEYSLGIAFMKNNGLTIADAGISFTRISVTAGTGEWTFETPGTGTPTVPESNTGSIDLTATTLQAPDGALSLKVPANAAATIGAPKIVDGVSVSTGKLGNFQVEDGRVVSHPGWTLTSTVADFKNAGGTTILAKQLGVSPFVVSKPTGAGSAPATAQTAGTAVFPSAFATADNSATVGTTVLDADLTFVAPATSAAGTYTSKMTLTLASK